MESVNPKFALSRSKTVCTRPKIVVSSLPEVSTEAVALIKTRLRCEFNLSIYHFGFLLTDFRRCDNN